MTEAKFGRIIARGSDEFVACSVDSCERQRSRGEYCEAHYRRLLRTGSLRLDKPMRTYGLPAVERVMRQIDHQGECWVFTGSITSTGYGRVGELGQNAVAAHRATYEHFVGPVPEGLDLDHLCHNRACVNPAHLEPVTHTENVMRGDGPRIQRERWERYRQGKVAA